MLSTIRYVGIHVIHGFRQYRSDAVDPSHHCSVVKLFRSAVTMVSGVRRSVVTSLTFRAVFTSCAGVRVG